MTDIEIQKNALIQGIKLYNDGRYKDALAFFLSIDTKSGPSLDAASSADLAYYLGLCYARLGSYEDALAYLEQVVTDEENVTTPEVKERVQQCRFILAVAYVTSNRKSLAKFELDKLLEAGYKEANVYAALAHIYYLDGDVDTCIKYYEKSLDLDGENATALNGLGYVMAEDGRDLAKALSYCKKASDIAPDSASLDSLGWVYHKLGMDEQAKTYLAKALLLNNRATSDTMRQDIKKHIKIVSDNSSESV